MSSSSKSSSSQATTSNDNRVVAGDSSSVATGSASLATGNATQLNGSGNVITTLDKDVAQAAIAAANESSKAGLSLASSTVSQGLSAVVKLSDNEAAITEASRVANANLAESLASTAITNLKQNNDSTSTQTLTQLTTAAQNAGVAIAVVAVAYLIFKK